jgi:sulfide:quinone oxidoreductase
MAKILILGGGFGGLITAERLSETLGNEHQITLVSPSRTFTFYPALVRLAFGHCKSDDITFDLPAKLTELNVRFVQGEAVKIKHELRRVQVTGEDFNGDISYDYLVIAFGRRLATEKVGGFFEHAQHLLGTKAALRFGKAVKTFRKGDIVVGLAPDAFLPVPVCETAFALAQKFAHEIENKEISVSVVFPETIEKAFGGANLHRKLEKALEKHHINIITAFPVKEITENKLKSQGKQAIKYDLLMLIPPFRGQAFFSDLGFTNSSNFVVTDDFMRVQDAERVYAVGDIVAFPGPKLAYMAARQAQIAAENIASEIAGNEPRKLYHHEIAVIIDEGGADSIFLHYGIWDDCLYHLKEGRMWSRMKNTNNQLWETVGEGFTKMKNNF